MKEKTYLTWLLPRELGVVHFRRYYHGLEMNR